MPFNLTVFIFSRYNRIRRLRAAVWAYLPT
nr:MAG TPA: hypothetical protein [Caudoviricetes sp.]